MLNRLFEKAPPDETETVRSVTAVGVHRDPRRSRRIRFVVRLLGIGVILSLCIAVAGAGTGLFLQHRYDKNIERFGDPFKELPKASRPPDVAAGAENILLLGSDSRITAANPDAWIRSAQHTDSIMVAHIPANRARLTVTSIPRDSRIAIPGHGKDKINAAFSFGGPTLMVRTVENYTGVRIDHVMIVDFDGFKDITDELGGVRIAVPAGSGTTAAGFTPGIQSMSGTTALAYVRQRHDLPGGDFARVKRQQSWIRAVALKTLQRGTLANPIKLNAVLGSLTRSIAADNGFTIGTMRSLAFSMRNLNGANLTFLTAPVSGGDRSPAGDKAVVLLDPAANKALWAAIAHDTVDAWLSRHPSAVLAGPRG